MIQIADSLIKLFRVLCSTKKYINNYIARDKCYYCEILRHFPFLEIYLYESALKAPYTYSKNTNMIKL